MRRKWMIIPLAIVAIPLFAFIGGESVKLLWNWLLPPLFGWREVTFWQALGLLVLCRILFGSFGGRGGPRHTSRMTPEERERFRQRMRSSGCENHFCGGATGAFAARRSASFSAAIRLDGSARPLPAMSKAVPWSGEVRTNGKPSVTLTA